MSAEFKKFLAEEKRLLQEKGCYRQMKTMDGASQAKISLNGKEVINFASNNYLGLANSNLLKQAVIKSLNEFGAGAGASRLLSGNLALHEQLEKILAQFKKTPAALLFNCGYMANCGLLSALSFRHDIIFSDQYNHASIIDGIILSRAKLIRYPHKDMAELRKLLIQNQQHRAKRFIVTDSVFSMDGDIAPLRDIVDLATEFEATVIVDEAHATGIYGKNGHGITELLDLEGEVDIQMGTLGKALGGFGAFVAADSLVIDYLINKARPFIFTTALPPPAIAAALKALDIVQNRPDLRDTLLQQANWFREELKNIGFNTLNSETHIIPILVGENEKAVQFSQKLVDAGIYAPAIRPPTVPQGTARLRISLMATHKMPDLEKALQILVKIGKKIRLI